MNPSIYIVACPPGMVLGRLNSMTYCVLTCPPGASFVGETVSGGTMDVCILSSEEEILIARGLDYVGETGVECTPDRIGGGCTKDETTYGIMKWKGDYKYIAGVLPTALNDGVYYSYRRYNGHQWENVAELVADCIYTTSHPRFLVQFPDSGDETKVQYTKCMDAARLQGDCPGIANDTQPFEGKSITCKLTIPQAQAYVGLMNDNPNCQGNTYEGCHFCDPGFLYRIYGHHNLYTNTIPYPTHCTLAKPIDQQLVCKLIYPTAFHTSNSTQFDCFHLSRKYIYTIYIHTILYNIYSHTPPSFNIK